MWLATDYLGNWRSRVLHMSEFHCKGDNVPHVVARY